jgi:hypothetical protein
VSVALGAGAFAFIVGALVFLVGETGAAQAWTDPGYS